MSNANAPDFKYQRDTYIAFSMAAADLLIELDADGRIAHTIGATKALLAADNVMLKGADLRGLFQPSERAILSRLLHKARKSGRIEPAALYLTQGGAKPILVNVGACFLTNRNVLHVTLTVLAESLSVGLPKRDDITGLLSMCDFQHMAEKSINPTDADSGAAMLHEMRLIRMGGLTQAMKTMPGDRSRQLMADIGGLLRANSVESSSAAQLDAENFGLIASTSGTQQAERQLVSDLGHTLEAAGIRPGAVRPNVTTLSMDTGNLDEVGVAKALAYAISTFTRNESKMPLSLEASMQAAMAATVEKYDNLHTVITTGAFQLHYQPVVSLKTREISHFEALLRFPGDSSPYQTIRFSEQLGLIPEIDAAVYVRGIEELKRQPDARVAVNLSGHSVQSDAFCNALNATVRKNADLAGRLLFELTETAEIEQIDNAANFLNNLRRLGFSVCLDDFGSGASGYNYLRRFEADYIKIDGHFLRTARDNKRERALIRSIALLSHELGAQVVGEMIEDEAAARLAVELGLDLGQGYLFGRPERELRLPELVNPSRRKGVTESWG